MNPLIEIAATEVESLLSLGATAEMAGRRYEGKIYLARLLGFSAFMTLLVSLLNRVSPFSFLTILAGMAYVVGATRFLSEGGFLTRATACVMTLFFLHSLDYIIGFTLAMLIGNSPSVYQSFDTLLHTGETRTIFTLINKSVQTGLFCFLRPYLHYIGRLPNRLMAVLFFVGTAAYVIMSSLLQMIITDSLFVMQAAVILSWVFITVGILACILATILSNKYQQERNRNNLSLLANRLMEKNYRDLSAHQRTLAKRLHDFTNHMKTLEALSKESPAAQAYIAELLSTTYRNVKRCRSGNDVIDAIINCKAEEAEAQGIPFTYSVRLTEPLRISSVDLCAVLANQLDNALEASLKLPQESERFVKVIVEQRNNFLSFRVENRVAQNPFDAHGHLVSTKKGDPSLHGLGLKNIRDAVEKHMGTLQNLCRENVFVSFAVMQNTV